MHKKEVRIGLLGCGVVGSGLVDIIERNRALIEERTGVSLRVQRVLVRDASKARVVPSSMITTDASDIIDASDIDTVVELMGGVEPSFTYLSRAVQNGKHVVTANKAMLSQVGYKLFRQAALKGLHVGFEASVCGGVPIVRALRQALVGNRITSVCGIVNGTSNYILTQMAEHGLSFDDAVQSARERGFCEADPSFDVEGIDAAQKIVVLAQLAFQARVSLEDVDVSGITDVTAMDIAQAQALGYVIKHIGCASMVGGALDVRVHSSMVPKNHPLASVRNEFNAVMLQGDAIGDMLFQGKGAGSLPTASAVLSDIVDVALHEQSGRYHVPTSVRYEKMHDREAQFYLRFPILDRPGVIGRITMALGQHGISISHAHAALVGSNSQGAGDVVIVVHRCSESALRRALEDIGRFSMLRGKPVTLRIHEDPSVQPHDPDADAVIKAWPLFHETVRATA
jgi:homoserine dehydrogenase